MLLDHRCDSRHPGHSSRLRLRPDRAPAPRGADCVPADTGARCLSLRRCTEKARGTGTIVRLDGDAGARDRSRQSKPILGDERGCAYVIYTSGRRGIEGSAGKPGSVHGSRRDEGGFASTSTTSGRCSIRTPSTCPSGAVGRCSYGRAGGGGAVRRGRSPQAFHALLVHERVTVSARPPVPAGGRRRWQRQRAELRSDLRRRGDRSAGRDLVSSAGAATTARQRVRHHRTTVHVTYRPRAPRPTGSRGPIRAPIPDLQVYLDRNRRPADGAGRAAVGSGRRAGHSSS